MEFWGDQDWRVAQEEEEKGNWAVDLREGNTVTTWTKLLDPEQRGKDKLTRQGV